MIESVVLVNWIKFSARAASMKALALVLLKLCVLLCAVRGESTTSSRFAMLDEQIETTSGSFFQISVSGPVQVCSQLKDSLNLCEVQLVM